MINIVLYEAATLIFLRLLLVLSLVFGLSTAHTTQAFTCQSHYHDNNGNYGNKESYDVK